MATGDNPPGLAAFLGGRLFAPLPGPSVAPLFLRADDVPAASSSAPLWAFGHSGAGSGRHAGAPLFAYSDPSGNVRQASAPLSLRAADSAAGVGNVNLWSRGAAFEASAGSDLCAWNAESGWSLSASMFVSGGGGLEGWVPGEAGMSLHLARAPAAAVTLHMNGPGTPASGGLALSCPGGVGPSASATLALPSTAGGPSSPARLYTHGW